MQSHDVIRLQGYMGLVSVVDYRSSTNHKIFRLRQKILLRKGEHKHKTIQDGEAILLELCKATQCYQNNLDILRFDIFHLKVADAQLSPVKPHELSPTSSAAKYHSLKLYHQVQIWCWDSQVAQDKGWFLQRCQ